jgi:hypothetical protein
LGDHLQSCFVGFDLFFFTNFFKMLNGIAGADLPEVEDLATT